MKLLLVEDQERMALALCGILREERYEVDYCCDGIEGLEAIKSGIYDVIILDVMLPGMDGYEIAKNVRKNGITTPILMLTAKNEIDDKVKGLDSGADDYLTKPFMVKELLARLRALCRRINNVEYGILSFGDIALDIATFDLYCTTNEQRVKLSEKEYRILEYLITNKGRILTRAQIAMKIWGYESESEYNNVEVYMTFVRKKLSFIEAKTKIKAARGLGYELRCDNVQKNQG